MVLVENSSYSILAEMTHDDGFYPATPEDDVRAMDTVMTRMHERERSFYSKRVTGNGTTRSEYASSIDTSISVKSHRTYRTARSLDLQHTSPRHVTNISLALGLQHTPPSHVPINPLAPGLQQTTPRATGYTETNATILNGNVPFTSKNSAISNSYTSARQYTLTNSHGSSTDSSPLQSRMQSRCDSRRSYISASSVSFDFDQGEDIRLEDVKQQRTPHVPVRHTTDVYNRVCSQCGVIPSQTYVRQAAKSRLVSMANTSLSHLTVKPIAISLVRDFHIYTLDLSGNDIGPLGVMYIAETLRENCTIFELDLSSTNPGADGLEVLAKCLALNTSIRVLRLESNNIEHRETHYIVDIIEKCRSLCELYLGHNCLGYAGGKLLAIELAKNKTLQTLDLQWNHFRKESAKHLCHALKTNDVLRRLNLSWNGIGKEGCIALARALPRNRRLLELDLTNTRIDCIALQFLLHGLVRNRALETILLGKNPMTTAGAKAVVKAITSKGKDTAIKYINLDDIPVDGHFVQQVNQLKLARGVDVDHGPEMFSATELIAKEHDPHDLNRFDPVMVIVEYMRIDNLRLIDLFQFFDNRGRGLVSRKDLRDGVSILGLPLTEHHLDLIMQSIDTKKDGYIDMEEFMVAQRDMSKVIIQRTTKAKGKGKEDLGLKELRQILKELVQKRNQRNKDKASARHRPTTPGHVVVVTKRTPMSLAVTRPNYAPIAETSFTNPQP